MKKFNINYYVYIQITEYGFEQLKCKFPEDYIEHHILHRKTTINGEDWYKLQLHDVCSSFDVAMGRPLQYSTNILIDEKDLTEINN